MGDQKYVFFYGTEQINKVLKKNIIFRTVLIIVFSLVGILVNYRLPTGRQILIVFLLFYGAYYLYLIMLSVVDLLNSKDKLPMASGTVIFTKGGIFRPLMIRNEKGIKIRLITDKDIFNVGDKVEVYFTRKSRIAISCRVKK